MIKSWGELGEVLAEIENRLSFLENSLPNTTEDEYDEFKAKVLQDPEVLKEYLKPSQILKMTDTQVSYLRRSLIEYIDKKLTKVDKQTKDYI